MDLLESSFFKGKELDRCVPAPSEVRILSAGADNLHSAPPPVRFEHLNLIVKFGPHVTVAEAQTLWAVKTVFGEEVPVPQLYGWRVDEKGVVFIYLQIIRGQVLREEWNTLSVSDKSAVCDHLH